jgi:hypothetical protein
MSDKWILRITALVAKGRVIRNDLRRCFRCARETGLHSIERQPGFRRHLSENALTLQVT